ncbi:hypothetical protein EVB91_011 [Rhizobium phage RHph_I1_18]|nr:hypothetical protein EVB91_011 [Rhizobium phage RHph_I1_18]
MNLLAALLPCVYFVITGRIIRGIIALIMMCTLIGWIFASLWALSVRNQAVENANFKKLDRKFDKMANSAFQR